MKQLKFKTVLFLFFMVFNLILNPSYADNKPVKAATKNKQSVAMVFDFMGKTYTHRWSKDNLHEFTPLNDPDLNKWHDMVTYIVHDNIHKGNFNQLISSVNGNFKKQDAVFISVMESKKGDEVLEVVVFPGEPLEMTFVKFSIVDNKGVITLYAHRLYGKQSKKSIDKWLTDNVNKTSREVAKLAIVPPKMLKLLPQSAN